MMAVDPLGTLPMFPTPEPTPVAKPYGDVTGGHGEIRYAKYAQPKTRRVPCDDCLLALGEGLTSAATRPAAHKRTQAGVGTLLLCHAHKQTRKEAEDK